MLLGLAAVCIWNGIESGFDDSFRDWHTSEHMRERLSIPGFLRGRRYVSDENEYFTLYELSSIDMLTSEHYLARLNAPTPWTLESIKHFKDTVRAATQVRSTHGFGTAGVLGTIAFNQISDHAALAGLAAQDDKNGIIGRHLCLLQQDASSVPTTESRRRSNLAPPEAILLIEGFKREQVVAECDRAVAAMTHAAPSKVGYYRHEFTCEPRDV